MPLHTKVDGGWLCEATGKVADVVWSDHARWCREGHSANECKHCSEGGKTVAEMLYDLNEKARLEHEAKRQRRCK
jgi:hypothetical protein